MPYLICPCNLKLTFFMAIMDILGILRLDMVLERFPLRWVVRLKAPLRDMTDRDATLVVCMLRL